MFETTHDVLTQLGQFALVGFFLGFLYDLFRILRILFRHPKLIVNIEDILFMPFAAFVLFCFSVEIGLGAFRLYYLLSALFGAAAYHFTLGYLTGFVAELIRKILFAFLKIINKIAVQPLKRLFRLICQKITPLFGAICRKSKKIAEKIRMPLKRQRDIVYNNSISNMGGVGGEERSVIKAKVRKKA